MDFLLIVVAIGGFVVAIVMLVLASRANRLHAESEERVETLEAMATGAVLFAHASAAEPVREPALPERSPIAEDLDLALSLNEFADEDDVPRATFAPTARVYPFVMTVPAAAGASRVQVSFERAGSRSRT